MDSILFERLFKVASGDWGLTHWQADRHGDSVHRDNRLSRAAGAFRRHRPTPRCPDEPAGMSAGQPRRGSAILLSGGPAPLYGIELELE